MQPKFREIKEIDQKATGEEAKQRRLNSVIAQKVIAKRMGISQAYLSDLEKGKRNWTLAMLSKFEKAVKMRRAAKTYFAFCTLMKQWKIGSSYDVARRIKELGEISIAGTILQSKMEEGRAHSMFSDMRMDGEWFRDCPKIRKFVLEKTKIFHCEDEKFAKQLRAPVKP